VFTIGLGTAIEPRNVNRAWTALCKRAGIARAITVHDLRHAFGTYLLASGVDIKTVSGQMRHSRLTTTADFYLHMLEDVQRDAADRMDAIITDLRTPVREAKRSS